MMEVVDTVRNPAYEISLEEARSLGYDVDPGDIIKIEVSPRDFGRIAAQTARQVIMQRLKDAERQSYITTFLQNRRNRNRRAVQGRGGPSSNSNRQ